MRAIDADAFKDYIRGACEEMKHLYKDNGAWAKEITESFCKDIDEQPTIQPEITHEQAVEYLQSTGWIREHDLQMMLDGVHRLTAQPEPCEDAVSREVLKDGFTEMCNLICPYTKKQQHVMCGSCLMGTAFDVLEATPSVTPKQRTGKWIKLDMHRGMADHKCTACKQECYVPTCMGEPIYAFCPNCGAKMEVNNESN